MEQEILKSIEGGYPKKWFEIVTSDDTTGDFTYDSNILLDRLFWQCLGKALGWKGTIGREYILPTADMSAPANPIQLQMWQYWKHCFSDHLDEGKNVESFFNQLLK